METKKIIIIIAVGIYMIIGLALGVFSSAMANSSDDLELVRKWYFYPKMILLWPLVILTAGGI